MKTKIENIDFDETSAEHAAVFLSQIHIPKGYKVVIDTSKLGALASVKMTFEAKDISLLKAISIVAESIGANILIHPGTVYLTPKRPPQAPLATP